MALFNSDFEVTRGYLQNLKISSSGVHYLGEGWDSRVDESNVGGPHQWGSLQDFWRLGRPGFAGLLRFSHKLLNDQVVSPHFFQILWIQLWTLAVSLAKTVGGSYTVCTFQPLTSAQQYGNRFENPIFYLFRSFFLVPFCWLSPLFRIISGKVLVSSCL